MTLFSRLLAGLTLLLAAVLLLLSLTAAVAVWFLRQPVTSRATNLLARIESALQVAQNGLTSLQTSLDRSSERLLSVRQEQRKLDQQTNPPSSARRLLARTVQQRLSPELGDAHSTLHTVAEASIVVSSILEDIGNVPFLANAGLDSQDLTRLNQRLLQVESSAWELSRLLGDPDSSAEADAQLSRVEQTILALRTLITQYESKLLQARQQKELLQSRIFPWITPATLLLSLLCFWFALSQISLLVHAWSWCRHSSSSPHPV